MSKSTISIVELTLRFSTQEKARVYIEEKRWGKDLVNIKCPCCSSTKITKRGGKRKGYFVCYSCKKEFTVRTGTVFERSGIPLNKWLVALYCIVTHRKGISSLELSKTVGITQKSAWFMLMKVRKACETGDEMLNGIVEIDDCSIGGTERNKHKNKKTKGTQGKSTKTKTLVLGLRERESGRVKAMVIQSANAETMQRILDGNVKIGSTISTDGATCFKGIENYDRISVNHSAKEFVKDMASTNGVESMWALLKRSVNGTYHHINKKYINRYINEFTFRLNEGNVRYHTMVRIDALLDNAFKSKVTHKEVLL